MHGMPRSQSLKGFNRFVRIVHANIHRRNEQIDSTAKGFTPSRERTKWMILQKERPGFEPALCRGSEWPSSPEALRGYTH